MGRGPGAIQTAIIDAIGDGGAHPLLHIARAAGHDITKLPVRQSFTRAAYKLRDDGHADLWDMPYLTSRGVSNSVTNRQVVTCISIRGRDLADDDWLAAKFRCGAVFDPDVTYGLRYAIGEASLDAMVAAKAAGTSPRYEDLESPTERALKAAGLWPTGYGPWKLMAERNAR